MGAGGEGIVTKISAKHLTIEVAVKCWEHRHLDTLAGAQYFYFDQNGNGREDEADRDIGVVPTLMTEEEFKEWAKENTSP
jgi:hypothetical protein